MVSRRNRLAKKKFVKYHDWPKYKNEQYILIQRAGQSKFLSVWVQSSCDEFSKRMNGFFYLNVSRCSSNIVNYILDISSNTFQAKSRLYYSHLRNKTHSYASRKKVRTRENSMTIPAKIMDSRCHESCSVKKTKLKTCTNL